MRNKSSASPAPQSTVSLTDRPFGTDEQVALIQKQIRSFIAHTNNPAVLRELETVMKSGRDNIGWKALGREFIAALKEAPFEG